MRRYLIAVLGASLGGVATAETHSRALGLALAVIWARIIWRGWIEEGDK